jgi:predicted enzyme involved in methoxymalonyl-ACP biosynthesis
MSKLAQAYVRILDLVHKPRAECAVVDLDNTCWGGVLGEDGRTGIDIGSEGIGLAYADFQRSLLNLRDQGLSPLVTPTAASISSN